MKPKDAYGLEKGKYYIVTCARGPMSEGDYLQLKHDLIEAGIQATVLFVYDHDAVRIQEKKDGKLKTENETGKV